MKSSAALLGLLGVFVANGVEAAPATSVLHEKREIELTTQGVRVEPEALIPLRIALSQSNLDGGYDRLMEVSHPDSPKYGQHLSAAEVHDLFAPAQESIDVVKHWLLSSGVAEGDIFHYENRGWLAVDLPAEHAERLLSTQYYEHEHTHDGSVRIGCDAYSLPPHVAAHVDFVKPGVKMSAPLRKRVLERRDLPGGAPQGPVHAPAHVKQTQFGDLHTPPSQEDIAPNLRNCGTSITIQCIQALYHIPRNNASDPANAMGLYETADAFAVQDISLFFARYVKYVPPNTVPQVISVDGGVAPVPTDSKRNQGESVIDIDLSTSLIYPQRVVVYQVDDTPTANGKFGKAGFLNSFLDSVDGSYCNYTAFGITGDSPGIDEVYPDTKYPKGYKGQRQCGAYSLTRVVSISYGEAEVYFPRRYVERQCNEFMKLGLQGHSVLVASGDYGVASFPGAAGDKQGCLSAAGLKGQVYAPDYPAGCPYITVVGATRLYPSDTVRAPESAMQVNLSALRVQNGLPPFEPYEFFASGGGFSNFFTPPSYQATAVSNYLASYGPKVASYVANSTGTNYGEGGGLYNRAGRGYPDVSANGAYLGVYLNASENVFFGTSLASPIFGSVLTLLNEQLSTVGKGPVGFVNPVLYANPGVLNDITNGSNPNCGSSGFTASPGWDPVTGLGTPNYPKMLKLFMGL